MNSKMIHRRSLSLPRRGTTYVLVLSIAVIASTVAMGALSICVANRRTAQLESDYAQAGRLVESGIELALAKVEFDPAWRATLTPYQNGSYSPAVRLGRGGCRMQYVDPVDADISDAAADPIRIYSRGIYGQSKRQFSIAALQQGRPLDVLRTAIHADGDLVIESSLIASQGPVSSNTTVELLTGIIAGNVEASSIVSPVGETVVSGTSLSPAPSKTMPSSELFSIYKTMATEIPVPLLTPANTLTGSLNPANNPGDPARTNVDGIYFIDVEPDATVTIEDVRIDGTLLVNLAGANSKLEIDEGVVWRPSRIGLPALIVYTENDTDNSVTIKCAGDLVEGSNTTAASLNGLFHIIRNTVAPQSKTIVNAQNKIVGSIVADGPVDVTGLSHLVADRNLVSQPPLGYTTALDSSNRIANGQMDNGLMLWSPTTFDAGGGGTKLEPNDPSGTGTIRIFDRESAAAGIYQDVTTWLEQSGSDSTIAGSLDVLLESTAENVSVVLEWATSANGIQQTAVTGIGGLSPSSIAFSFTPTWTGKLKQARLIISTTTTTQAYQIDNLTVDDNRLNKPSNLIAVPSTWRVEPLQ